MNRAIIRRKSLQKLIKSEYKKYQDHKKIKLGKIFRLSDSGTDCNWSLEIERKNGWEAAADFIRPHIIALRSQYMLADGRHPDKTQTADAV